MFPAWMTKQTILPYMSYPVLTHFTALSEPLHDATKVRIYLGFILTQHVRAQRGWAVAEDNNPLLTDNKFCPGICKWAATLRSYCLHIFNFIIEFLYPDLTWLGIKYQFICFACVMDTCWWLPATFAVSESRGKHLLKHNSHILWHLMSGWNNKNTFSLYYILFLSVI